MDNRRVVVDRPIGIDRHLPSEHHDDRGIYRKPASHRQGHDGRMLDYGQSALDPLSRTDQKKPTIVDQRPNLRMEPPLRPEAG
jgi:hypothetical protein